MKFEESLVVFGTPDEARPFSMVAGFERTNSELKIFWEVQGPLDELILPTRSVTPQSRDGLWEKTCFEFFWGLRGQQEYEEWNFSPSRDWAHFYFSSSRIRRSGNPMPPVDVNFHQDSTVMGRLDVTIAGLLAKKLEFNLAVVLEHSTRVKTYWAIRHHEAKPDFHDRALWLEEKVSE